MRDLRQAMDARAEEQKRHGRLEISAVVMSSLDECLYYGLDLETWVQEGLGSTP